jgi:hypothetical protein
MEYAPLDRLAQRALWWTELAWAVVKLRENSPGMTYGGTADYTQWKELMAILDRQLASPLDEYEEDEDEEETDDDEDVPIDLWPTELVGLR